MAKNDDLFEVDFGEIGATPMVQSGVTQTDTSTVDDIPQEKETPKNDSAFELVDKLIDSTDEDTEETKDEVEEKIEKTKKTPPSAKETNDASDSFAFVFAKYQQEEGNLSFELDEKELHEIIERSGEAAAMTYLFDKEAEFRSAKLKEMYDEDAKEFIELKDAGVDPETAKELVGAKVKFESITEEDLEEKEHIRKQVLSQNYRNTTNFPEEKIKKLVDRAIATGEDIEEAKEALVAIKEFNDENIKLEKKKVAEAEKSQAEQAKAARENMQKMIAETNEILPGYVASKQTLKNIEKMIMEPAVKTKDGRVLNGVWAKFNEDPKGLIKLAYFMESGMWDGKLDKLERTAKTAAIKKMEEVIKSKSNGIGKGRTTASADDDDSMSSMKNVFKL